MSRVNSSSNQDFEFSQSPQRTETWHFVVINDPRAARSEQSRRRVRSHAMRQYHRRARDIATRGNRPLRQSELELDVTLLLEHSIPDPIGIANREDELYGHLLDRTCIMFRTMQDIGFLHQVRQTAAFCQLLAMSSWHLAHLNQICSADEHLQFSLLATQELQRQINDPLNCSSDDAVGSVLVFACCANLIHDTVTLNTHMHGLRLILDLRGGLHTLNPNSVLRIMLHWADVNGAYFQDKPPCFPPPLHLLPSPKPELFFSSSNGSNASTNDQIAHICEAVRNVQALLHAETRSRNVWQDATFQGFYITPILGQVLAMRRQCLDEAGTLDISLELFRLAAVLYISALRTPFGVDTLSTEPLYASKIHGILISFRLNENIPPMMLVWVLSVAFTSNCDVDKKHYFERTLMDLIVLLGITDFGKLRDIITNFIWDNDLLASQSSSLHTLFIS